MKAVTWHGRKDMRVTEVLPLDDAPAAYADFRHKRDGLVKAVFTP